MQFLLIFGIAFAIGAVAFALQNNAPATVTLALWHFESTLAVVLLAALGLGALIASLVSIPTVLRHRWIGGRLRRQVEGLEKEKIALEQRVAALEAEAERLRPPAPAAPEEQKPFADLRAMLTGQTPPSNPAGE